MRYFIIILSLFFLSQGLKAKTNLSANHLMMHIDRNCYISGDVVFISNYLSIGCNELILYVDLTDANGQFITGEKLEVKDHKANGILVIPDTIKTGEYFIRSYSLSQAMVYGKSTLRRKIYITNRFGNNGSMVHATPIQNIQALNIDSLNSKSDAIELIMNRSVYKQRSLISATINNKNGEGICASIAVKPMSAYESYYDSINNLFEADDFATKELLNSEKDNDVYIEDKGFLLRGIARDSRTKEPLVNALVLLSTPDSVFNLKYAITNDSGAFCMLLPCFFGNKNFYFSSYTYPSFELIKSSEVLLESNFLVANEDAKTMQNNAGFELSRDSLNLLKSIINNAYELSYFHELKKQKDFVNYEDIFLSRPYKLSVNIADYVDFPNFTEITKEILPFVRLREVERGLVFQVVDVEENRVKSNPLVCVDGVPLTDMLNVLPWGSSKLKRVDVQTNVRYWGDVVFNNGMVFIWTKDQDFWKKETVNYTHKIMVQGLQLPVKATFPKYDIDAATIVPDFRQILYWNSFVECDEDKIVVEFYASDERGIFEITLKGVSADLGIYTIKKYFKVE